MCLSCELGPLGAPLVHGRWCVSPVTEVWVFITVVVSFVAPAFTLTPTRVVHTVSQGGGTLLSLPTVRSKPPKCAPEPPGSYSWAALLCSWCTSSWCLHLRGKAVCFSGSVNTGTQVPVHLGRLLCPRSKLFEEPQTCRQSATHNQKMPRPRAWVHPSTAQLYLG